jgi:glutathione S-transferase
MAIKLYYAPGACSFASHIALEEAGLDYETQRINTSAGEQRSPEYLKINPRGRVPTLVVDGNVLTENVGILTYIAGGYPRAGLWPRDTWHQAKAVSTMAWLSNTVHPAYAHIVRASRYTPDETAQQAIAAHAKTMFFDCLKEVDGLLEGRQWAIGDHFTVVDGYLLVFYRWGNRSRMDVKSLPNYTKLAQRVMARPAVKQVMQDEGITLD